MLSKSEVIERAKAAFAEDAARSPAMTLRAGSYIDSYDTPPALDPEVDKLTDDYIEKYGYFALPHLDPDSWRHYLPALIDYTLRNLSMPETMVPDGLVWSLRPPDRDPPRFGSLNKEQEAVISAFLEVLCYGEHNFCEDAACQALEEYWMPGAQYRPKDDGSQG
jgi:hypothetical protein